ncbi:MAG: ABC transporter ATP-binding protein [Sulfobacillus thermosulfidooxidans]|uniref:ABC transporter ATP-binding protein n=1 Tax=Sulfobacillus TaxID=28033 RepID=UPI000CD24422|nr:ABC transporter ATP-binding protein [Sulfobacillus sp. hq2]POB10686.1 heme ABC transporter [Sulfobacillus sp. hq2]PSR36493.1 MAG: ABC transporter ATP-binding protein [Sulfobacillus thermosulfidooxidans]
MAKEITGPILRALTLCKTIGAHAVLREVSFSMERGSGLAIMGPNGAGKSTLLKVLSGLWAPSGGELWRFGRRVGDETSSDQRVVLLGHHSFLYPSLTAFENLLFYAHLWGLRKARQRVVEVLRQVDLLWAQNDLLQTFSRGMVQRAALARVLLADAQLLLLDEPYTGLDGAGRQLLDRILGDQKRTGRSFILASHDEDDVIRVADAVALLVGGRMVWWSYTDKLRPEQLQRVCRGDYDKEGA